MTTATPRASSTVWAPRTSRPSPSRRALQLPRPLAPGQFPAVATTVANHSGRVTHSSSISRSVANATRHRRANNRRAASLRAPREARRTQHQLFHRRRRRRRLQSGGAMSDSLESYCDSDEDAVRSAPVAAASPAKRQRVLAPPEAALQAPPAEAPRAPRSETSAAEDHRTDQQTAPPQLVVATPTPQIPPSSTAAAASAAHATLRAAAPVPQAGATAGGADAKPRVCPHCRKEFPSGNALFLHLPGCRRQFSVAKASRRPPVGSRQPQR
eukprot:3693675-Prymnesium_polylepis.1